MSCMCSYKLKDFRYFAVAFLCCVSVLLHFHAAKLCHISFPIIFFYVESHMEFTLCPFFQELSLYGIARSDRCSHWKYVSFIRVPQNALQSWLSSRPRRPSSDTTLADHLLRIVSCSFPQACVYFHYCSLSSVHHMGCRWRLKYKQIRAIEIFQRTASVAEPSCPRFVS